MLRTFNDAEFLRKAIDGVLAQDYRPIEVVAFDDGSRDDSQRILEEFRASADFRVLVLGDGANHGHMFAFKEAVNRCSGKYVAILDGDDVWQSGKLTAQVEWFERDRRAVLCGHDVECFDSSSGAVLWTARGRGLLQSGVGAAHSVRNGPIFPTSAIMLLREAIPSDFNPLGLSGYTDWNLWSECLAEGGAFGYVEGTYSRYRRNPQGWVATATASPDGSLSVLESGLVWLGMFDARYPEYHAECSFRRATLIGNHGRVLFEHGEKRAARTYLRAAAAASVTGGWKALGLLALTALPEGLSRRTFKLANSARRALRPDSVEAPR